MKVNFLILSTLLFLTIYLGVDINKKSFKIDRLNNKVYTQIVEIEKQKNEINLKLKDDILIVKYGESYADFAKKLEKFEEIDLIISLANVYGYDWRYFVCQIYYESEFNPKAQSHKNAKGLMQLTKTVYKNIDPYSPIDNIIVGVTYWDYLYKQFDYLSEEDRIKFTFAAYNCGITRVNEIRKEHKISSYSNIEKYLPKETREYVNNIIRLYINIT